MTTAEAIKEINSRIELANRDYPDLVKEYIEALEMAVEALRKQEPMKPNERSCEFDGENSDLEVIGNIHDNPELMGKRIDWEVEA